MQLILVATAAPNLPQDLPMGKHPVMLAYENLEQIVLRGSELNGVLPHLHAALGEVDSEFAGDKSRCTFGPGAPQRNADARQQLTGAERLGQVIVRARVQSGDFVTLLIANGQNQDR